MVRGLCILLAIFMLSACGAVKVSAEPEQMQPQEMIAESETDSAGQEAESPLAEESRESEQVRDSESEQQEEQVAGSGAERPSKKVFEVEQAGNVHPEEPKTESADSGTGLLPSEETDETVQGESLESGQEESALKITIGDYELLATFADNSSAEAFRELLAQGPLTIEMEDYGGFEKVGPLGTTLPRNDTSITTQPGDVILYQGNQITIYYGTNSWSFTRLARIDDPSDLREKLGDGAVSVTFSLE